MISDTRHVSMAEVDVCRLAWTTHLSGRLDTLPALLAREFIPLPRWLVAIEAATSRYPFLDNGLPPFLAQLLEPLRGAGSLPLARFVGAFIRSRSGTSCFIDTDALLYRLVIELERKWDLVVVDCPDRSTYPARCQIRLTDAGDRVLRHVTTIDVRTSELLRWWGGKDLRTPSQ